VSKWPDTKDFRLDGPRTSVVKKGNLAVAPPTGVDCSDAGQTVTSNRDITDGKLQMKQQMLFGADCS